MLGSRTRPTPVGDRFGVFGTRRLRSLTLRHLLHAERRPDRAQTTVTDLRDQMNRVTSTTERRSTPRSRLTDPRVAAVLPAIVISIAYLLFSPASQDFASGDFRARLFREGAYVWDLHWFGGHPLPGYGIVSPVLSGLLGVVPVAIVSLIVASWAFGAIIANCKLTYPSLPSPTVATMLFSVGCALSLWGGRLTFGPAVAFGTLCVLCLQKQRSSLAIVTALLCGLSSPIGALSLAIIVFSCWTTRAFPRRLLVLVGAAAVVPAGIIVLLFPEGGWYPFPGGSFISLTIALAFVGWFGRRVPLVRTLVAVYAVVALVAFIVRSPLGGNVVRLAWLAAGPAAVITFTKFRRTLLPAFVIFTVIWGWSYVKLGFVVADATTKPNYYDSLAAFVQAQPGGVQRVEVVPTESFRQADELALKINIARGWEAQLDRELNPEFYDGLTIDTYHTWLLRNSVSLVALPMASVQPISRLEETIIETAPAYLHLVWSDAQWRVYRVTDARPLADFGATIAAVGTDSLTIEAPHAGVITVRFRYSKWYQIASGNACATRSPDGWLELHVRTPGTIVASVALSLENAVGADECS